MAKKLGYAVNHVASPAGQATLAARGLTTQDLARAIAEFQRRETVQVGTLIGVNKDGAFGSTRKDWRPDLPDAFAEPLLTIPWVQILELLGRVPKGTTGELLESGGQHPMTKIVRLSDATYNAIAAAAILPFKSTGERQPDGTWLVPIEDETFERIEAQRLTGESDEDVILRMLRAYLGQKPN